MYDGIAGFADAVAPFVTEGLDAGEATMVVLRAPQASALRARLGRRADDVQFADMDTLGRNPGRIIGAWQAFVDEHAGSVRGVGEPVWSERAPDELLEAQLHEALLNLAFAEARGFRLLCPYDRASLLPAVLHEAQRTHGAAPPEDLLTPFGAPLRPPAGRPYALAIDRWSVVEVRRTVEARALELGFTRHRVWDLVLAVHELA